MYLAIDTSSDYAGLALTQDNSVLAEQTWLCGRNHTVELLPHLDALLKQSAKQMKDIQGIVVATGPGSFNGLRVGLGTAKGLAFSLDIPIVGISTLEAAAYQHAEFGIPVCAILNAGRSEISYAIYQLKNGMWQCLVPPSLTTIAELCSRINQTTLFCGEPTAAMLEEIRALLGDRAVIPPPAGLLRRPAFLAELGAKRIASGDVDDAATLQPIYLRRPNISQPKSRGAGAVNLP
jgi:tRNA threonylcarbamoyl adenosine modification protein YeaZ